MYHGVNERVAAGEITQLVIELGIGSNEILWQRDTVGEGCIHGARLEKRGGGGEIFAPGDGDGAEPVFVGCATGAAVADEGELLGGGGVTRDEGHGFVEAIVEGSGVIVVKVGEVVFVGEGYVVAGDGVGDFVAKCEVED